MDNDKTHGTGHSYTSRASDHVIALARLGTILPVVREITQIKMYYYNPPQT